MLGCPGSAGADGTVARPPRSPRRPAGQDASLNSHRVRAPRQSRWGLDGAGAGTGWAQGGHGAGGPVVHVAGTNLLRALGRRALLQRGAPVPGARAWSGAEGIHAGGRGRLCITCVWDGSVGTGVAGPSGSLGPALCVIYTFALSFRSHLERKQLLVAWVEAWLTLLLECSP